MTPDYTWGSIMISEVVLGQPLDTFLSLGLSPLHGHGSWLVCEVGLRGCSYVREEPSYSFKWNNRLSSRNNWHLVANEPEPYILCPWVPIWSTLGTHVDQMDAHGHKMYCSTGLANAKRKGVLALPLWTFRGMGWRHVKGQGLHPATLNPEKKIQNFLSPTKELCPPHLIL